MTVEEAREFLNEYLKKNNYLSILSDFTESELKEAYRNLLKIYHSDQQKGDQTICSKIIEAYRTLTSVFKKEIKSPKKDNFIIQVKANHIKKVKKKMEIVLQRNKQTSMNPELLTSLNDKLNTLISEISLRNTEDEIINLERAFLSELHGFYKQYASVFFEYYFIREVEIKEPLNYNVEIEEFFNQLDRIKEKYGYKEKMEATVKQYENWCGFEKLKPKIEAILLKIKPCFKTSLSIPSILNFVTKEIESLFNKYYELEKKAKEIEKGSSSVLNQKLEAIIFNLPYSDFEETEKKLCILKGQMENEIQTDLYVKVDEKGDSIDTSSFYLVFKINSFGCKVFKWNKNEEESPEIKEISQEKFKENYCLLDGFLSEENQIFKDLEKELYKDLIFEKKEYTKNEIKRIIMKEMQNAITKNRGRRN